jgi:hypothetical protein
MDASKFAQSKGTYLNATHLATGNLAAVISHVEMHRIGRDKEEKLVVFFEGIFRGLALNKTNLDALIEAFGPETTDWEDGKVVLFVVKTEFDGKERDGVRVSINRDDFRPIDKRSTPTPVPDSADMRDEIPF